MQVSNQPRAADNLLTKEEPTVPSVGISAALQYTLWKEDRFIGLAGTLILISRSCDRNLLLP